MQNDARLMRGVEAEEIELRELLRDRTMQLVGNVAANGFLAFGISRFSTKEFLEELRKERGVRGSIAYASGDEFFRDPYCCHDLAAADPPIRRFTGSHNTIIYTPDEVLRQLDVPGLSEAA